MNYDISVKNLNGIEVFRGQNFTEALTKLTLKKYATYPNVAVWQSPEQERYQAYEDLAFSTNRDELSQSCAEFLKDYCNNTGSCMCCIFFRNAQCVLKYHDPYRWELEEGEPDA